MQRVAEELLSELGRRPDLTLQVIVLRSSWRWIHFRTAPFLVRAYFRLRRLIQSGELDAIIFSSMVSATLSIPLRRLLKQHRVGSLAIVHGLDITTPSAVYQKIVGRVFGSIDMILPVSQATADACTQRGLPEDRIRVIHNGVDIARFSQPSSSESSNESCRNELLLAFSETGSAFPPDAFLLCSVGRLVKRKGFAWFIEHVMPQLPEHVHYWIAGDGPESRVISDAIESSGLANRVRTCGRVTEDQLHALYRGSNLFLMPNVRVEGDMEGFGIVMLEAGMNGLPTVASRIEGILEVVREDENGTFVETEDATGFARAILRYEADRELLYAAKSRARTYTETTFGWEAVTDHYIDVCRTVCRNVGG